MWDLVKSSTRARHAKLMHILEYLGVWKVVEAERMRRRDGDGY